MKLDHPHILKLFQFHHSKTETDNKLYLVMEYASGGDVYDYIDEDPDDRLSEEEVRDIFRQTVLAVDFLHRNKIVHR